MTASKNAAIVTGAASGMGLALTRHLASKGWRVVMADINDAGEAISKEFGDQVLWVKTDVADWDSQAAMFEKAFSWEPSISFLAANAGVVTDPTAPSIMATDTSAPPQKPLLPAISVNLEGVIYGIKLFLHYFSKESSPAVIQGSAKGRIIITSSEAGFYAVPADPLYAAGKHGLVGLARSLGRFYLANYGIAVNTINPGLVPTNLAQSIISITPKEYITPMSTIIRAFDELLSGNHAGQTVEASGNNLYYQQQQAYPDEIARWVCDDMEGVLRQKMGRL